MKTITFFSFLCLMILDIKGQVLPTDNLLTMATLSKPKLENYLSKKGYAFAGKEQLNDTMLSRYVFRKLNEKNKKNIDTTVRYFYRTDVKKEFFITFQTTSLPEFTELVERFKKAGFYCNGSMDSLQSEVLLFQHNDFTVRTYCTVNDSIKNYCLQVQKKIFPRPNDLYYGDDLLAFTSHEYLVYYFGKSNVKNDVYYFSGNEIARCSVLFLNTDRQVVFIWKDEINKYTIAHLLFGGQQKLESSKEDNSFIRENSWIFKSGIRAGMSLFELRRLNENNFKFYGRNSPNSGSVIFDSSGKLNFSKEDIILGCMNCRENSFFSSDVVNADDALADGRILFVLSIVLNPELNTRQF
jgi:hypothetical protein